MLWAEDDIRKLVEQLTASSRRGSGANLTPEAVNIALAALRAYRDGRSPRPVTEAIVGFQVVAFDGMDLPSEVLASTADERIAHTTLAKAKRRFPDQKIVLRGKSRSGERVNLDV